MVPRRSQSAGTDVLPVGKFLRSLLAALRTTLTGAARINHHKLPTGAFSLVRKHHQEGGPPDIGYRLRQHSTRRPNGIVLFLKIPGSDPPTSAPTFPVAEVPLP